MKIEKIILLCVFGSIWVPILALVAIAATDDFLSPITRLAGGFSGFLMLIGLSLMLFLTWRDL